MKKDNFYIYKQDKDGKKVLERINKGQDVILHDGSFVISDSVAVVGNCFFSGIESLKSIKIPNSVVEFGNYAFSGTFLKEIDIPDSVIYFGDGCFAGCRNLKKIKLPKSLEYLPSHTFDECFSLEEIDIPDSVMDIGEECFLKCSKLVRVKLPYGLSYLRDSVFKFCGSLEEIDIPDSVMDIGEECFWDCSNLIKIKLPANLKKLGKYLFHGCSSLKKVELPDGIEEVDYSFYNCTGVKKIVLSKELKIISNSAFFNCKSLEKIIMYDKVEEIGNNCFLDCLKLKEIKLSKNLKKIGYKCFNGCKSLERVEFFENIKEIENNIFLGCDSLKEVIFSYTSYQTLLVFINNNIKFLKSIINFSIEKKFFIDLVFCGVKLNPFQKLRIGMILGVDSFNFIRFKEKDELDSEKESNDYLDNDSSIFLNNFGINDVEVNKLLDIIISLCDKLPESSKKMVMDKLHLLILKYKDDFLAAKPMLGESNKGLVFGSSDVAFLKPQLLAALDNIKNNLCREDELIRYIADLGKYKKILDIEVKNVDDDDQSIEGIIKKILFYSSYLDDVKKGSYLSKLKDFIECELKKANSTFDNLIDSGYELTLNDELDSNKRLLLFVSSMFDEIILQVNKIKPFKDLYDSLIFGDMGQEYIEGDDFASFVNNISFVLNSLSNDNYKNYLVSMFHNVLDKYKKILEEIFKSEDRLQNIRYDDFEKEIRQELNTVLEIINKYAYLDQYEVNKSYSKNLMEQLYFCLEIINCDGKTKGDENKVQPIVSFVIDIINYVFDNECFDNVNIEKVKEKLRNTIHFYMDRLKSNKVDDFKDYNALLRNIFKDMAGIYIEVQNYAFEMRNYSRYDLWNDSDVHFGRRN